MQVMRNSGTCPATRNGGGQHKWMRCNQGWHMEDRTCNSKDEGLALFQDMHAHEHKNFLHTSVNDIEISPSNKLGGFFLLQNLYLLSPDHTEKTDYDWLLTPPATPLFPCLDKDSLQISVDHSVYTRSTSASRPSRICKPLLSTNASELHSRPTHRCPGPQTPTSMASSSGISSTFTTRGRSASQAGSNTILRPAMPRKSLGRSTVISRASTQSTAPKLRRANTARSVWSLSGEINGLPSKARIRGSSGSPKLQVWQAAELGAEPPSNLHKSPSKRTSTSSWSTTARSRQRSHHVQVRCSYSQATAQALHVQWPNSSSASKVSSSTTIQSCTNSEGSIISSSDHGWDFGMTSPTSTCGTSRSLGRWLGTERSDDYSPIESRQEPAPKMGGMSSVRRSLDPLMQREAHCCTSENMFQPLLSSAPTSSFYDVQHTVVRHHPPSSIVDASITASSNASSEHGIKVFPGNKSSDEGEVEVESLDQMNPNYEKIHMGQMKGKPGNRSFDSRVLAEDEPKSLDESTTHSDHEVLLEYEDTKETSSHGSDIQGQVDMGADSNVGQPSLKVYAESTLSTHEASLEAKPSLPSFSLEEATSRILLCSSIVRDLVYKATSIAAVKEAIAVMQTPYHIKVRDLYAKYMRSLRRKLSKAGAWKPRNLGMKPAFKRSQKAYAEDIPKEIIQHPTPINATRKVDNHNRVEDENALPNTIDDKSSLKLSVSSNCQCAVM